MVTKSIEQFHAVEPPRHNAELIVPLVSDGVYSVLDLGCNDGQWLEAFVSLGITDVIGVDGGGMLEHLRFDPAKFIEHDLTKPLDLGRKFDLVTCIEVAEHLPESAAETLLDTITRHGDRILFSAAQPGQGGSGHVNERPLEYWSYRFRQRGYFVSLRLQARLPNDVDWWLKLNLMEFHKTCPGVL